MTGIDEYLQQVRGAMLGMDAAVRDDILKELRSHLSESVAANGGDAGPALASLGAPTEVGREYRRVYGYGGPFKVLFLALAALLALASAPFLSVTADGAVPNPFALLGLLALVAWLLAVSVAAGSRLGLYAGLAACLARFAVAGVLAATYPGATIEALGGLTFVVANLLLVVLGWLPGTAKKAWTKPGAEL